jgi:hypothetical protein
VAARVGFLGGAHLGGGDADDAAQYGFLLGVG